MRTVFGRGRGAALCLVGAVLAAAVTARPAEAEDMPAFPAVPTGAEILQGRNYFSEDICVATIQIAF